ncbi:MAG: ATP-binding protein, partial [Candidatus Micrarchaeota archaeon]
RHYAYDTGLQSTVSVSLSEDFGRRFENVVAIELVRRGYSLSYLQEDEYECDFIAQKPGSIPLAVQVWTGTGAVPQREWTGLELGMKRAKAQGLFLTKNPIDQQKPTGITVKRIEEWLTEPKTTR